MRGLYGVISLSDAKSYDKSYLRNASGNLTYFLLCSNTSMIVLF